MFMTGFMVFLGTAALLAKLPRRKMLRALHHDAVVDVTVTVVVLAIHFGTFSGVMAATIAGLLTSMLTSSMKKLVGHSDGKMYYPGLVALKVYRVANR